MSGVTSIIRADEVLLGLLILFFIGVVAVLIYEICKR